MATEFQRQFTTIFGEDPSGASQVTGATKFALNLKAASAIRAMENATTSKTLRLAIDDAKSLQKTTEKVADVGDVLEGFGATEAAGNFLEGRLGTAGSASTGLGTQMLAGTNPYLAVGLAAGEHIPYVGPAIRGTQKYIGRKIDESAVGRIINPALQEVGRGIRNIVPGEIATAVGGVGGLPGTVASELRGIPYAFGAAAELDAYGDKVNAIRAYLDTLGSDISEDTWVGSIPGTRTGQVGMFKTDIPINMTVEELRQDPAGQKALANVATEIQGAEQVAEVDAEEAAYWEDIGTTDPATGQPLTYDVRPVSSQYGIIGRAEGGGNAYKDEYGIWDAATGNLLAAPGTSEYLSSEVPLSQESFHPPAPTAQVQDLIPQVVTKAAPPVKQHSPGGGYWTGIPTPDLSRQYAPPRPVPKLETGPTRTFGRTHAARRSELLGRQ